MIEAFVGSYIQKGLNGGEIESPQKLATILRDKICFEYNDKGVKKELPHRSLVREIQKFIHKSKEKLQKPEK